MEAVIFDLGNVLLPFNWQVSADRFCARTGRPRRELDDYIVTTPFLNQLEVGEITGEQFFQAVSRDFGFTGGYDEFALIWSDIFTPDNDMIALAAALKPRYRRFVLSNTIPMHMDFVFSRYPFIHTFDGLILSYEVHLMKPDHRIYEQALQQYGLTAARTVFIDDILANVEAAEAVGLKGIHHRDARRTREGLTKLGIAGI